ncbi:N-alpha-acetyltransferase 40 isoform X2 [Latimeria chalumnae]|uniref:N-alpha-acetyltransferase 40 isoform X2 n=1 Tax=Latimeria chalumnae TaxID=7897 RepID=UPI00313A98D2
MGRKSTKAKEKKQKRLEERAAMDAVFAKVEAANKLGDPLEAFPVFKKYDRNGYEQSEWGWKDREKKEEMTDDRAWYLIAREEGSTTVAFSHFRFDVECGDEVLYWYFTAFPLASMPSHRFALKSESSRFDFDEPRMCRTIPPPPRQTSSATCCRNKEQRGQNSVKLLRSARLLHGEEPPYWWGGAGTKKKKKGRKWSSMPSRLARRLVRSAVTWEIGAAGVETRCGGDELGLARGSLVPSYRARLWSGGWDASRVPPALPIRGGSTRGREKKEGKQAVGGGAQSPPPPSSPIWGLDSPALRR